MVLDVIINDNSMTIQIDDPFHPDIDAITTEINRFASLNKIAMAGIDLRGLIPKMIKGIAGCEQGCPANAKGFVSRGFKSFDLQYIEGGILAAQLSMGEGKIFQLKMFPDF